MMQYVLILHLLQTICQNNSKKLMMIVLVVVVVCYCYRGGTNVVELMLCKKL